MMDQNRVILYLNAAQCDLEKGSGINLIYCFDEICLLKKIVQLGSVKKTYQSILAHRNPPPPYSPPTPQFSHVRIHIRTELTSHFNTFCCVFSSFQYNNSFIKREVFSHTWA